MAHIDLFIEAHKVAPESIEALSENRFRVGGNEFHVWTEEEAANFGYAAGGVETSDPTLKVYRIF